MTATLSGAQAAREVPDPTNFWLIPPFPVPQLVTEGFVFAQRIPANSMKQVPLWRGSLISRALKAAWVRALPSGSFVDGSRV